jgi:hypothetical protein
MRGSEYPLGRDDRTTAKAGTSIPREAQRDLIGEISDVGWRAAYDK